MKFKKILLLPILLASLIIKIDLHAQGQSAKPPYDASVESTLITSVKVSWLEESYDETGFAIERRVEGSASFSVVGSVPANSTEFIDSPGGGFVANTLYYYRIRATKSGTPDSAPTAEVAIAPNAIPAAPTSATVGLNDSTSSTNRQIDISWLDSALNEDRFDLEMSNDGASFTNVATIPPHRLTGRALYSYTLPGAILPANTPLYFRVRAHSGVGNSGYATGQLITPTFHANAAAIRSWYVDLQNSGNHDGSSWANAWYGLGGIAWAVVKPGDTIFISGGAAPDVAKNYPAGPIIVRRAGTANAPLVIKSSQESQHNGRVHLDGSLTISGNYTYLDGSKSDNAIAQFQSTSSVARISENINFRISEGLGLWSGAGTDNRFQWLEITNLDLNDRHGIWIGGENNLDHSVIAYCWIHGVGQDGINAGGVQNPRFDNLIIHHSLIELAGDDGMESNAGTTVYNSQFLDGRFVRGHPDGIQSTGNHQRYYNNIFRNWGSSHILTQGWDAVYTGIQIYGNLFYATPGKESATTSIELKWYPDQHSWNTRARSDWSDWVIVNNTFMTGPSVAVGFAKREFVNDVYLKNLHIQNNIFWNSGVATGTVTGVPGGATSTQPITNCCWHGSDTGSESLVYFEDNTVGKSDPTRSSQIGMFGVIYPSAEALNAATLYDRNSSQAPPFYSLGSFDFRLTTSLGGATPSVLNLPAGLPDIDLDMEGVRRGSDGIWDRGAFEFLSGALNTPPRSPGNLRMSP